jgi:uncharacterized protein (TIGR03435 family)
MCISSAALCQPTAPIPTFGVESVKPNRSSQRGSIDTQPGKVTVPNVSLKLIVQAASGVKVYQISGPGWLESARDDTRMPTLQLLLADRFKLALHREARDLPAWMLVPGNKGPKLHASKDDGLVEIKRKGPESLTGLFDITLDWTRDQGQLQSSSSITWRKVPTAN